MPRLIVLPADPGTRSGVALAVRSDLDRLDVREDDAVIVHAKDSSLAHARTLPHPPRASARRVLNLLRLRPSLEPSPSQLAALGAAAEFDRVFCGETAYYRPLRALHPGAPMIVRVHHSYTLLRERFLQLRPPVDALFRLNLEIFARLEREIANDGRATIAFITDVEQREWQRVHGSGRHETWPVTSGRVAPARPPTAPRLAWLGGVTSHKRHAVRYLVEHVHRPLRRRCPQVELHLFGRRTEPFHDPAGGVFGLGPHDGEDLPLGGDALFVNPDLLGGGVKLKVDTYLARGAAFISTPFGMEGQALPEDREHALVHPIDEWCDRIETYFAELGVLTLRPVARSGA